MRAATDLHPDDTAHRGDLAAQLRAVRETAGVSAGRLAVILGYRDHSGVRQMERHHAWKAETLQRWARALNQQVTFTLTGLTVPADGDDLAAMYSAVLALPGVNPAYADRTLVRAAVNDMARVRRSLMSAPEFGRRIGLDDKSVLWREANPDGTHLASMQQTARALGGALTAELAPVPTTLWSTAA